MSTTTIEKHEFPRFTRVRTALQKHIYGLWVLITALAVADAASMYAALGLTRTISESNPSVGEINPATKVSSKQ